jgi:superfamily I DNA/RNA helicase
LVDECQDLKKQILNLVTKVFGHQQTNFTFVGDPKQNIMGFAGATEDIFELLVQEFPNLARNTISISFRLPQEIAAFANHFIAKFMPYRVAIETVKSNGGQKPQILITGREHDYQLSQSEKEEIRRELRKEEILEEKELEKIKRYLVRKKKEINDCKYI